MHRTWPVLVAALLVVSSARADQTTATVQEALKNQGFYYGEVTGRKNSDTTAAIRRYQIRNGLQITGEIDAETLRSLGVGSGTRRSAPPAPAPAAPPPAEDDEESGQSAEIAPQDAPPAPPSRRPNGVYAPPEPRGPRREVRGVFHGTPYEMAPPEVQRHVIVGAQSLLARAGYYRNGIDGVYGPGMATAVRFFQSRLGLLPNGRLNMETLGALGLLPGQRRSRLAPSWRRLPPRPVYRGQWIPE